MHDARKLVTLLFADLVESTALGERLDPESLRRIVSRYFAEMAAVLEQHGGTVEKFVGDEVMAVFGVPAVHEDDALRAVRAAIAMRARLGTLNAEIEATWDVRLELRIGINTGEVVAGDPSAGHGFVTGDAVNLAKRIQQAAGPGEILLGELTHRLVRHAVETTTLGPVTLKGIGGPVSLERLEAVDPTARTFPRRHDAPLVGRQAELAALHGAFERAVESRRAELVTLLGPAGIGKSRLARELVVQLAGEAAVLVGRCPPYGEGITFWPVREIQPDADLEGPSEEIFWRVRMWLEEQARRQPLVVCLDDLHWAEPTFLDLVEYLAGWIRDAPVLLLCLARPDLLEKRPDWPARGESAVVLAPLTPPETVELLHELAAPDDARASIVEAAEGNPLFIEQMTAMAADEGTGVPAVASIRALLAARLDRLERDEAAVIERAAVVGRDFALRAVVDLAPAELRARVPSLLLALVRKELVRPAPVDENDGFRFRHALIRDAAYEAMPKELRAELHERHADWLEKAGATDVHTGYQLEQAVCLRRELGGESARMRSLTERAVDLLGRAGTRALGRGDLPAAVSLLERALALSDDAPRLLVELGTALFRNGRLEPAETALDRAVELARAEGDRALELRATIERQFLRSFASPSRAGRDNAAVAESAIPELERLGDELALAKAWWLLSETAVIEGRWAPRAEALEQALAHAGRAEGARHERSAIATLLAQALYYGPTPVDDAVERCRTLLDDSGSDRTLRAGVGTPLAGLLAMQGRFDEARRLYADATSLSDELGLRFRRATASPIGAEIEALAGHAETAERVLREGYDTLAAMGERGVRSTLAACLADLLATRDRTDEAEHMAEVALELSEEDDVATQVLAQAASARVAARRGELADARRLSAHARRLAERTDAPQLRSAALVACAAAAGDDGEARRWLGQARRVQSEKGNRVAADRIAASLPEGVMR
jgi:class 3 adenylate cyclase/tetratricopeptide (TPR) repeat protein